MERDVDYVERDVSEIEWAIAHDARRLWPILFRGGAVIPNNDDFAAGVFEDYTRHRAHPYLRKIETAGGWKAYEKAHRTKLLATFVPKFTHLVPKELDARAAKGQGRHPFTRVYPSRVRVKGAQLGPT